jgi:hypothetical protein
MRTEPVGRIEATRAASAPSTTTVSGSLPETRSAGSRAIVDDGEVLVEACTNEL